MLEESKYDMAEKTGDNPELGNVTSRAEGIMENHRADAVFGDMNEKGPNYRNVSICWQSLLSKVKSNAHWSGQLAWNCCNYDEDLYWTWHPLYPVWI